MPNNMDSARISLLTIGLIVIVQICCVAGKIYTETELANELRQTHRVPEEEINYWVCIAMRESGLNTAAVSKANRHGNSGHGLFQINDLYSCSTTEVGKGCSAHCSSFEDDNIADDVACARKIHGEFKGITGVGFDAWDSFKNYCVINVVPPKITANANNNNNKWGKVYERCELARELRDVHQISTDKVGVWVCIMEKSGFNTSQQIPLNGEGNLNHGILQINDIYWCGQNKVGGNCNIECSKFEDENIADDLECGQKIVKDTMSYAGDGFKGK